MHRPGAGGAIGKIIGFWPKVHFLALLGKKEPKQRKEQEETEPLDLSLT